MRLVAVQKLYYGGRAIKAGAAFDASDEDSRILKGTGKAKDEPKKAVQVKTRALRSSSDGAQRRLDEVETSTEQPLSQSRYHRADMRAED